MNKEIRNRLFGLPCGQGLSWGRLWAIIRSGVTWYKREINTVGGYFILWYSSDGGTTWEELMNLDLTEDSVVIDLGHAYHHRIVGTEYRVDNFLTSLGYSGIENTDWENLYST